MRLWLSHVGDVEGFVAGYAELLEAWAAAGVDGLVLGRMVFDAREVPAHSCGKAPFPSPRGSATRSTFTPHAGVYRALGLTPPDAPTGDDAELRGRLEVALRAVKDRGWQLWLFDPFTGAVTTGPDGHPELICDEQARLSQSARLVDTAQAFPMADGFIIDRPAWGYEITEIPLPALARWRLIWDEVPRVIAPRAHDLGYEYEELVVARDQLWERLHRLTREDIEAGDPARAFGPHLATWLGFRQDALTGFYQTVRDVIDAQASGSVRFAVCPRTPAVGGMAGYDYRRAGAIADVVMPKLYFWQRGYDGLVGTVHRWSRTLTEWNPELTVADACRVIRLLFGEAIPVVEEEAGFDRLLTPDYVAGLVDRELGAALTAVGDQARLVPWLNSGRAPHHGDPMPAALLEQILERTEAAGVERFCYLNATNVTEGDWTVISRTCGTPWRPPAGKGWRPPDLLAS